MPLIKKNMEEGIDLKVVPMLPRLLCEELCSLNPMTDKLTFSVIWTLTPKGKKEPAAQHSDGDAPSPSHIVVKFQNTEDKEKIL
ncbi:hypothetical protein J1605_010848 [Eschrichtius robustus]|uniref:RNB domain-containing protein n=1 Tax=Eschrichtius robustus TaxID=9764 RepID=A0AB34GT12_ESCRO|nr:hypothetical protein J1605_010848 [Eschrichtius robustus]